MKNLLIFTLLTIAFSRYPACTSAPLDHGKVNLSSIGPCDTALWLRTYGPMERFGNPPDTSRIPYDPYKRGVLHHRCVMNVEGKVKKVLEMADGDVKIWLSVYAANFQPQGVQLPPGLFPLKRAELLPGNNNELVAEVVCAATPKRRGTGKDPKTGLDWKVPGIMSPVRDSQNDAAVYACMKYTNTIYLPPNPPKDHPELGEVIYVTGELVTDTGPEINKDPNTKAQQPYVVGHGGVEIHPVSMILR